MLVRIQPHVFDVLEIICFAANAMIHKPRLPTNHLSYAAVEGCATVLARRLTSRPSCERLALMPLLMTLSQSKYRTSSSIALSPECCAFIGTNITWEARGKPGSKEYATAVHLSKLKTISQLIHCWDLSLAFEKGLLRRFLQSPHRLPDSPRRLGGVASVRQSEAHC